MTLPTALRFACLTALGLAAMSDVHAQSPSVEWSGLAWMDYSYTLASDDPDNEGDNTFDYRRLYLTADARLDKAFRARVRMEARGRSTTVQGRPAPFVKDAWLRWQYASSGHRATLGVQPPPLFDITESVWGYRSLDATVLDRTGVRRSRDMGLRLDGPVTPGGALRYAAMVANGNGIRPDTGAEQGKAAYGQLRYDGEGPVRAALGVNYEARVPDGGSRESSVQTTALLGAVTETARVGMEGYLIHYGFEDPARNPVNGLGVSVFGAVSIAAKTSLVGRYDFVDADAERGGGHEHYILTAIAYRPIPDVAIMPNVLATLPSVADPTLLGRMTVAATF